MHCDEPIAEEEVAWVATQSPGEMPTLRGMHRDCQIRLVIGGLNHLMGTCLCHGGSDPPDPPFLSRREAATAAVLYYRWRDAEAKRGAKETGT
jgi:hypothetical protein